MKEEEWTDEVCSAMSVVGLGRALRAFDIVNVSGLRSFLIKKDEIVGLTDYYTQGADGSIVEIGEADRVDIRFLNGNEIITGCALMKNLAWFKRL